MDLYLTLLALGGVGMAAMAVSGVGRHGHGSARAHGRGAARAHGTPHSHAPHGASPRAEVSTAPPHSAPDAHPLIALISPRTIFSVCLGMGTTGLLLQRLIGGPVLLAVAVAGGIAFERLLVTPLWNFAFRFESQPALTLESAVSSEGTAVSSFDANGQGLVAIEVDGQVVQLLGTLQRDDRALHVKVRSGAKVRIEEVDIERNRCTVSLI
jgi:hypothetical protein